MIKLENISKTYIMGDSVVKAVDEVYLSIEQGEFVAIMGPSGSGKSTLMHLLGLLDAPDKGKFYLCGRDISKTNDDERALLRNRVMGFIFQKFYLLPRLKAVDNVNLPLIYSGLADSKKNAETRLKEVGLGDRMDHLSNQMSGGQQQRAAIARALIGDPLILFADEPTGNLDSKSTREIMELLDKLHSQGRTIIMVTHEAEVAAHAERVITMKDGKITEDKKQKKEFLLPKEKKDVCVDKIIQEKHSAKKAELWDHFKQAWFAISSNKVRTLLSVLGVLIGVGAVIAMIALGEGANKAITEQMAGLGANVLSIRPGSRRVGGVATVAGAVTRFSLADAEAISRLPSVKYASAFVSGSGRVIYRNKNWNSRIEGINASYSDIRSVSPIAGRYITEEDVRSRAKVAVLGQTVVRELFGEEYPVGKTIKVNRINFRVVGVLKERGGGGFRDNDDVVHMPVTTAMYRVLGKTFVDSIDADVRTPDLIETAKKEISELIVRRHRLTSDRDESFNVRDMTEIKSALETTTKTMTMLLSFIAMISLIVGGIGIMNIMLVSVTERTNEIGLRKAIGARRKDILTQFLIEAVMLTTLGGIFGILLGIGSSMLLVFFAGWAVEISLTAIIVSILFSVIVGITFGLWPANKASQLNPIDALRYE